MVLKRLKLEMLGLESGSLRLILLVEVPST